MGLLSATVAVTRFNVVVPPEGPDFERARFWEIEPGSEVRERMGFVPFELDAPWEVAQGRYVFRLRIDRIRPDATAVKERLRELVKAEMEATGKTFVGPKTRKKLRDLAEAESAMRQAPRTRIVECCIDGPILYVLSTAKTYLGTVVTLLRQAGVEGDFKAPWLDEAPEAEEMSDVVIPKELFRYLEEGAEILSAKIFVGAIPFRFDALSYRLSGVKLEPVKNEHWTIDVDQRLEQIAGVFETLDGKYAALKEKINAAPAAAPADAAGTPAAEAS
jgi:hypothetical protein